MKQLKYLFLTVLAFMICVVPVHAANGDGDVDLNGVVDLKDAKLVLGYIHNPNISYEKNLLADVNVDESIDYKDVLLILSFVEKKVSTLPSTDGKSYLVFGDANLDGKVTNEDIEAIENHFAEIELLNDVAQMLVDVNLDDVLNLQDLLLIKQKLGASTEFDVGDVNKDSNITIEDVRLVLKSITGKEAITEEQKKLADANADNKLDYTDALLILSYIDQRIPFLPTGNKSNLMFGDVNFDGKVTKEDPELLQNHYIENITLGEVAQVLGDVNFNGRIDSGDSVLILQYISGKIDSFTAYRMGDVNQDNVIDIKDVKTIISIVNREIVATDEQKKLADVNVDEKVDYTDAILLLSYLDKKISSLPVDEESSKNSLLYGDIDKDGDVDKDDIKLLEEYLNDNIEFDDIELILADVNVDGKIDDKDLEVLQNHLDKKEGYETLPYIDDNVPSADTGDLSLIIFASLLVVASTAAVLSYRKTRLN